MEILFYAQKSSKEIGISLSQFKIEAKSVFVFRLGINSMADYPCQTNHTKDEFSPKLRLNTNSSLTDNSFLV